MSKGEGQDPTQSFRPIRWWMVLLGIAAVVIMVGVATVLLIRASRGVTDPAEAAKLRVEVIRTVLTVGVGTGGAMALLLAGGRDDDLQCATRIEDRTGEHLIRAVSDTTHPDECPVTGEPGQLAADRLIHEPAHYW